MNCRTIRSWTLLGTALALSHLTAAAPPDTSEILSTFELHPDFSLEVVAMEPAVFDPVDLDFDEAGNPYVIEMPGYPFPEGESGKLVRLEDLDGDGYYESRHVFAEGFALADSLLRYGDGFLVASPPDLLWVRDTDGDGTADRQDVVLTGFTVENPQHNFGGLTYGFDNWVHAANGGNSGRVNKPGDTANRYPLRFEDFRMEIGSQSVERTGRSTGGFELAIDAYGREFGTHNLYPISHRVFPGHYVYDVFDAGSGPLTRIPDDEENGLVRIYSIGTQNTRVNHPEQSGYFSGSCGITYYGGGAFPEAFEGNVFIMDVVLNLVHRRALEPEGTTFVARRGRPKVEFLASRDRAFRPVNATVAPDGSLWVLDMHRDVIEHPEWIPDELEEKMDINAGKAQGRLFRVAPKSGLQPATPRFSRDDLESAVAALSHKNQWWRFTAQRLLVEWKAPGSEAVVRELFHSATSPLGRLHALCTLDGLGVLQEADILRALRDKEGGVREHGTRLAEPYLARSIDARNTVTALLSDPEPRVRMRAALALGSVTDAPSSDLLDALRNLSVQDAADPWMRMAIASVVKIDPLRLARRLLATTDDANKDGTDFLRLLAGQSAKQAQGNQFFEVLRESASQQSPSVTTAMLEGFGEGIPPRGDPPALSPENRDYHSQLTLDPNPAVARAAWEVQGAMGLVLTREQQSRLSQAGKIALDTSNDEAERLAQLRLFAFAPFEDREQDLYALLNPLNPPALQAEAIRQCASEGSQDVARALIERWATLGPATRSKASDVLLHRRANHKLLLDALEEEIILRGEMNFHLERRRTLLWARDPEVSARAEKLFSDAGVVTRREALEEMRPALELEGDAEWGEPIFNERCAQCHRVGDQGADVGPNLTEIFRKSPETILHDLVDPNAAVDEAFMSFSLETADGELYIGIIENESADEISLRDASGAELKFARSDIVEFRATGLSLMPEDLELGLDHQSMADLLAFLQQPR